MEKETDFLFTKHIRCTVCGETFETRVIKSGSLRRLEPDFDLRPRFRYVDALKYEVYSCPHCGYSAMSRYFENLTKIQKDLIRENIGSRFQPASTKAPETIDYKTAILRFKLALHNSEVKRAKLSEKAYICLKIAWLYNSYMEELPENTEEERAQKSALKQTKDQFYQKAFEAFKETVATEDFPICGMDTHTMDYLLAALACHFKEYAFASKAVSNILTSQTADRRIKDKALDLKTKIVEGIKKENQNV